MLIALLALFCYIAIATAETVVITGNEKVKDLTVYNNSRFTVYLEGYPGYTWILENIDELREADIRGLSLKKSFMNEYNTGDYAEGKPGVEDNSGYYIFNFQKRDVEIKEFPPIKFAYKKNDASDDDAGIRAQVNLKVAKSEPIPAYLVHDSNNMVLSVNEEGGEFDFRVNSNSTMYVYLYGSFSNDNTLSTGNSWFFENEDLIQSDHTLELLQIESFAEKSGPYRDPTIVTGYKYTFKVNPIAPGDVLPTLIFTYKESQDSTSYKSRAIVDLRVLSETIITFDTQKKREIVTIKEEVLQVEFDKDLSTGNDWILENLEEVKESNSIEACNVDKNGKPSVVVRTEDKPVALRFKFKIKEEANYGIIQPTLQFANINAKGEIIDHAELTVSVKHTVSEEELNNMTRPIINYDQEIHKDNIVYVESNTIFQIRLDCNRKNDWSVNNLQEISDSDYMDYIGNDYYSHCANFWIEINYWGDIDCIDDLFFRFRIWNVDENSELPEIQMKSNRSKFKDMTIKLKVKKAENEEEKGDESQEKEKEEECSFNGYKCCTDVHSTSDIYIDKDGEWSIENSEWCFIKKEADPKETEPPVDESKEDDDQKPKLIRSCPTEELGYSCCQEQHTHIYTFEDDDHQWAVENGQWCGLYSCTYTGSYPVCKTNPPVEYTDTEKWGIENGAWCVLCL